MNIFIYIRQGHLELWTGNMSRCVQRIAPLFNRIAIFTVTDDAFHGHPEPLTCPEDVIRYGLQFVYYTKEPGPLYSNTPGVKKIYNGSHSAVFQPYCAGKPNIKRICELYRREGFDDNKYCECNYDR